MGWVRFCCRKRITHISIFPHLGDLCVTCNRHPASAPITLNLTFSHQGRRDKRGEDGLPPLREQEWESGGSSPTSIFSHQVEVQPALLRSAHQVTTVEVIRLNRPPMRMSMGTRRPGHESSIRKVGTM